MNDIAKQRITLRERHPIKTFDRAVYRGIERKADFVRIFIEKFPPALVLSPARKERIIVARLFVVARIVERVRKVHEFADIVGERGEVFVRFARDVLAHAAKHGRKAVRRSVDASFVLYLELAERGVFFAHDPFDFRHDFARIVKSLFKNRTGESFFYSAAVRHVVAKLVKTEYDVSRRDARK